MLSLLLAVPSFLALCYTPTSLDRMHTQHYTDWPIISMWAQGDLEHLQVVPSPHQMSVHVHLSESPCFMKVRYYHSDTIQKAHRAQ